MGPMRMLRGTRGFGFAWVVCVAACGDSQDGRDVDVDSGNIDGAAEVADADPTEVADAEPTEASDLGGTEVADSGPSEVADSGPSGPLLDWPGARTEACTVTRAPAIPDPSDWAAYDLDVGPGDRAYLMAVERGFMGAGDGLFVAPLGLDGTVGARLVLDADPGYSNGAAMVRLGGDHASELLVAWGHMREDGAQALRVATVAIDAVTGKATVTRAGQDVAEVGWVNLQSIQLLVSGGGADAYVTASAFDAGGAPGVPSLRRVPLAADGTLRAGAGAVRTLVEDASDPSVVATADGIAAVWTASAGRGAEVFFGRFGADGAAIGTPRRLSVTGAEGVGSGLAYRGGRALIAAGGALWAAWSEWTFNGSWEAPEGHSTVRLAVLDQDGNGPTFEVQAAESDVVNQGASFFVNGDHIALTWLRGTAIHICGGCYVDYPVKVVLLDPATAAPVSEVATLDPVNGHGHSSALFAPLGAGVVVASSLDFHALTRPATAAFRCGPKAP